jgi:hypothetical protein
MTMSATAKAEHTWKRMPAGLTNKSSYQDL